MVWSRYIISLAICFAANSVGAEASVIDAATRNPVINLGYARYEGNRSPVTGVTTWFGLRYAAPPTGNNRWRAPLPIEQYGGYNASSIQNATTQGPTCVMQIPPWFAGEVPPTYKLGGQEDCLTVDVLVPNNPRSKSLPVWIEIHGGGYTVGSAATMPGYAMVNQSAGGLIFVSIQYRLGAYGFLNDPAIRADGTPNAGLLDQRLALEWVKNHISSFGGDPAKVTIHGGSAGGGSVNDQLIMYGGVADPPFRAAIAEYPWWQPYHNDTITSIQYQDLLMNTGCADLACLRKTPGKILASAANSTYYNGYFGVPGRHGRTYGHGDFYYGPVVDGKILQGLPSQELTKGHFSKVPLIVNHDQYEGVVFTNASIVKASQTEEDIRILWQQGSPAFFAKLFQLYPSIAGQPGFNRTAAIFGDAFVVCGTTQLAAAFRKAGVPVWKQIFNAGSQLHGATTPFLFGTTSSGLVTPVNATLSKIMKDWFVSFAATLDPNVKSYSGTPKPYWPGYGSNETTLQVNYTTIGLEADPDCNAKCDFFFENAQAILN